MDITQIVAQLVNQSQQAAQSIESQLSLQNIQSPEGMLDVQFKIFQYSNLLTCTSSVLKNFKDLLSSVIAKI